MFVSILLAVGFCLMFAGAVKLTLAITTTVIETLGTADAPFGDVAKLSITHTGMNKAGNYDANSPAGENVTQVVYGQIALVAGAVTLNLAAVTGLKGIAVDLTGLKIRTLHIRGKSTNANDITIAKGAANGFTGLGASYSQRLSPGRAALLEGDSTAVAAGVRTLDITGTGTQVLEFLITAGNN